MAPVIKVENLSKKYIIGHRKQERYTALRDVVANGVKRTIGKLLHPHAGQNDPEHEEFWALKDVSFDIQQGDRVGIIGRNGAGKSTLLKILSRITEPTSGKISIKGRVASLLEVGTGFHPELTGRENIYLNGAILGMSRAEIKRKFDEIVAFAEVEKFLDTPVKHYSSGMYVRLAFAVAAHLEPEILIVDEVLAVGDAQFQKKCLGKMEEVSLTGGRTVLFVSHQMGAIAQFCNKALLLDKGMITQSGEVKHVVNYYMNLSANNMDGFKAETAAGHKDVAIVRAQSYDIDGNPSVNFMHDQKIVIVITCKVNRWINGVDVRVAVRDSKRNVFTTDTEGMELLAQNEEAPEELHATVVIPAGILRPEQYFFKLAAYIPNQAILDLVEDALSVTVVDGGSKYAASEGLDYGCVFVDCKWVIDTNPSHQKALSL
ncbi:MAG: ABC transporter ATP-binding protein [Burkholderiales bacterium]|nr:ABC transporter ATP-binding protein [Burkholderiales bacterium]